jgi:hypothetical protein
MTKSTYKHLFLLGITGIGLFIVPKGSFGQQAVISTLRRDDVLIDHSRPSIFACIEIGGSGNGNRLDASVRVTNNSIWVLQFPAENGGLSHITRKLSDGREVAVLKDGTTFLPNYGIESASGLKVIKFLSLHLGTLSYLPPNSSAIFKVREQKKNVRIYLDFNYEWELNTVIQATPTHRLYIPLNGERRQQCD